MLKYSGKEISRWEKIYVISHIERVIKLLVMVSLMMVNLKMVNLSINTVKMTNL